MASISKVWEQGRVFYQDGDGAAPEPAVLIHVDSTGTLVLEQEERFITLSFASLDALCRELKAVKKEREVNDERPIRRGDG